MVGKCTFHSGRASSTSGRWCKNIRLDRVVAVASLRAEEGIGVGPCRIAQAAGAFLAGLVESRLAAGAGGLCAIGVLRLRQAVVGGRRRDAVIVVHVAAEGAPRVASGVAAQSSAQYEAPLPTSGSDGCGTGSSSVQQKPAGSAPSGPGPVPRRRSPDRAQPARQIDAEEIESGRFGRAATVAVAGDRVGLKAARGHPTTPQNTTKRFA